jgi:hypothetical protein
MGSCSFPLPAHLLLSVPSSRPAESGLHAPYAYSPSGEVLGRPPAAPLPKVSARRGPIPRTNRAPHAASDVQRQALDARQDEEKDPALETAHLFKPALDELFKAAYELQQLVSLFSSVGELTALKRVEREPLPPAGEADSVALAVTKRASQVAQSREVLEHAKEAMAKELDAQRVFHAQLQVLMARWKLVAPAHGLVPGPLLSEESLAFDCGPGASVEEAIVGRAPGGEVCLAPLPPSTLRVTLLRAGSEVLGAAELEFAPPAAAVGSGGNSSDDSHAVSLQTAESNLEARRRDGIVSALLAALRVADGGVVEFDGGEFSLKFERVAPREDGQKEGSAVCEAVLAMLRKRAPLADVCAAAKQALAWPAVAAALDRLGLARTHWVHEDALQSRCDVQLTRSLRWTLELMLSRGELSVGGFEPGVFASPFAPAMYSPEQAVQAVARAAELAHCREAVDMFALVCPQTAVLCDVDVSRALVSVTTPRHAFTFAPTLQPDNGGARFACTRDGQDVPLPRSASAVQEFRRLVLASEP